MVKGQIKKEYLSAPLYNLPILLWQYKTPRMRAVRDSKKRGCWLGFEGQEGEIEKQGGSLRCHHEQMEVGKNWQRESLWGRHLKQGWVEGVGPRDKGPCLVGRV